MPDELHLITIGGNVAGQFRENVQHWHILGATNDTPYLNANSLAQYWDTTIRPLWLAVNADMYTLDYVNVRRLGPTPGQYAQVDYAPGDQTGGRTGGTVGEQLCPCVTLIPPMGVKSAGRVFLPSVAKGDVNLNVYLAGYVTVVNTLFNTMITGSAVAGGLASLVIYSRKLNITSAVAAFHLSTVIGYQRKRSRPVGA